MEDDEDESEVHYDESASQGLSATYFVCKRSFLQVYFVEHSTLRRHCTCHVKPATPSRNTSVDEDPATGLVRPSSRIQHRQPNDGV